MRRLSAAVVIVLLASACRVATGQGGAPSPSASETMPAATPTSLATVLAAHLPGWCGAEGSGGGAPVPPNTPRPVYTPDPHTLLCVAMENKSSADMVVIGTSEHPDHSLLKACTGVSSTGPVPLGTWGFQVGRTTPSLAISGSVLATFDSSQVTGEPPYLIDIVVNPDLSVMIQQRDSLPELPIARYC